MPRQDCAAANRFPSVRGIVQLWNVPDRGPWRSANRRKRNQIQVEFGFIAVKTLFHGVSDYRVSAMYLEFENLDDPEDEITPPTYNATAGIEYYDSLLDSPTRDFLRVAMVQSPEIGIVPGDESYFGTGQGNRATCFALSQGVVGVHGKPYSAASNSKVFGLALVATPKPNDRTQDLVFARTYFDADQQVAKAPSSQIGATWQINFTV